MAMWLSRQCLSDIFIPREGGPLSRTRGTGLCRTGRCLRETLRLRNDSFEKEEE